MTLSIVSIGRVGIATSSGSDFTGVLGGGGESACAPTLEIDLVRDIPAERVLGAGGTSDGGSSGCDK